MTVCPIIAELRSERKKQRLTQRKLGEKAGYSYVMISRWELSHALPNVQKVADLANALGLDLCLRRRAE